MPQLSRSREHDALTNETEFFAEMSESYFGVNDFYLSVAGEPKQAEPEVLKLLEEIRGLEGDMTPSYDGAKDYMLPKHPFFYVALLLSLFAKPAVANDPADYSAWKHSGSVFVLTTSEGADLPPGASETGFPVLVRVHKDFFDFSQAKELGNDLRFSTAAGEPLAYQIEEWDPAKGIASVWVRIPTIQGNARQEIRLCWGKADAVSESSGKAVFNETNGFVSVWHMNEPVNDDVGTLPSKDTGTTAAAGMIGPSRHFPGGKGIFCGDKIPNYPSHAHPHSSEAWFRAEKPNTTILGWGNEGGGRGSKVRMQLRSPPHVYIDSDFSDVNGGGAVPMSEWVHVVHTYDGSQGKIYINGRLDGAAKPTMDIKTPSRLWLGGWYDNYDFVGDLDEVRISNVARSANWVKLEYENQKPLQTLTGMIVQPGDAFSVTPAKAIVNEGQSATITAQAGGAQKIYWTLERDGKETLVATDRLSFKFDAGRVHGDQKGTLHVKAVYPNEVKTRDVQVTIKEAVPEPVFTLRTLQKWNGRETIEVTPQITNIIDLKAQGAADLNINWSISGIAVLKDIVPEKLILTRAQNSGKLTVTATIDNGGTPTTHAVDISVTEPDHDPWMARTPAKDERPVDNQFYARDDKNEGTLLYNGTLAEAADSVFMRVFADDKPFKDDSTKLGPDKAYAFSVKLKPGLFKYKVELGSKTGNAEKVIGTVSNIVCGDAYLIDGQSNAEAVAWGDEKYPFTSPWIRSFGSPTGDPNRARLKRWSDAVARRDGGETQIGYWGMELGRRLVEDQKLPICIINGAVGGTRIDQHQRSASAPDDVETIYGRLLWRVREAKLTHGIRGILWHQGENDQGADGPTGGFGWETYHQYFIDMAAGWKTDYPNVQHYYVFQIWPKSCAMGIDGSDNRLREVQRTLPTAFSKLSVMSSLGIDPPGGCHYPPAGYAEFARLICPLLERDEYGVVSTKSVAAPNLREAIFANEKHDQILLSFDAPVRWDDSLATQFFLNGEAGKVASGKAAGKVLLLTLKAPSMVKKITYLDSKSWNQATLLRGENGIAALTFCDVPIEPARGVR